MSQTTSGRRKALATVAAVGALVLGVGMIPTPVPSTDASWTDTSSAQAHFQYVHQRHGYPVTPEEIHQYLDDLVNVSPEDVEELLNNADPEHIRTIIEVVGEHQNDGVIDHVNELDGLRPATPEGIEVESSAVVHTSYDGVHRNLCFNLEVYNFTPEEVMWELAFDTSASPFWSWEPYTNGEPNFSGDSQTNQGYWASQSWDPGTGEWTVAGTADPTGNQWWRAPDSAPINPGTSQNPSSANVNICMNTVPVPTVDHSLFTYDVSEAQGNQWYQELRVQARTRVETYIPWEFYVDLTQHVCPATLANPDIQVTVGAHSNDADNWVLQPLAGSSWDADTPYIFRVTRAPQAHDVLIRRREDGDGQPTVYPRYNQTFLKIEGHNNAQVLRPDANGNC